MEWQPIETAPKDGTRFVGLVPVGYRMAKYRPDICFFCNRLQRMIYDNWTKDPAPTHWMPLPAPPHPA